MDPSSIYPCGRINRRGFLTQAGGGFFGAALGAMWAADGKIEGAHMAPHFPPKAKSVIFLFMCGGISHIDTFDPKDNKYAGKLIDAIGFGDNVAEMKRPVIPILRTFTRYGKSGIPVSDWFPNVGGVIDEFAVVRSMWCNEGNHFPAVIETTTGHRGRQFDHPTLGAWVSYALGSANRNLPTFVNIGRASSPVQLTGGYLGAKSAATPFQPGETPIPNLYPPKTSNTAERDRQMRLLDDMNKEFRRTLRHQLGYRGPFAGLRSGGADAASRPFGGGFLEGAGACEGAVRNRRKGDGRFRAAVACWRGGWWRTTSASSRSVMPAAAMGLGMRMAI